MRTVSDKNDSFREALNYSANLYKAAYYMSGNLAETDDLVQEVYLKAYANWGKYKPGTNCKAWLFTILHNTYINHLYKEAKAPAALPNEKIEMFPASITAPAVELSKVVEEMVADEIKAAIKKLPAEYIEPIVLAWVGDFSYEEVAGILGCPTGTVMSRLHRARALLRYSLDEYRNRK